LDVGRWSVECGAWRWATPPRAIGRDIRDDADDIGWIDPDFLWEGRPGDAVRQETGRGARQVPVGKGKKRKEKGFIWNLSARYTT